MTNTTDPSTVPGSKGTDPAKGSLSLFPQEPKSSQAEEHPAKATSKASLSQEELDRLYRWDDDKSEEPYWQR